MNLSSPNTFQKFQKVIDNIKNKTNKFVNKINNSNEKIFALGVVLREYFITTFGLDKSKIPFISEKSRKVGLRCLGSDIELISEKLARNKSLKLF